MNDKPKSARIQYASDATVRTGPDGTVLSSSREPVSLHIESIKSIGVENIVDLEMHSINRIFNSVSHYLKFHGGGEVRFSYDAEGRLLEFEATNIAARIVDGDRLILMQKPDAAGP